MYFKKKSVHQVGHCLKLSSRGCEVVNLEVVVRFPAETNDTLLLQNVVPTLRPTMTSFASIPGAFLPYANRV